MGSGDAAARGAPASRAPRDAGETPRQALRRILSTGPHTALELSARVGSRERDVVTHLEHLQRSLRHGDERFVVDPARCLDCGYAFRERARLARPSACPKCRGQHLAAPVFRTARRS